jgi:hypothetical protein
MMEIRIWSLRSTDELQLVNVSYFSHFNKASLMCLTGDTKQDCNLWLILLSKLYFMILQFVPTVVLKKSVSFVTYDSSKKKKKKYFVRSNMPIHPAVPPRVIMTCVKVLSWWKFYQFTVDLRYNKSSFELLLNFECTSKQHHCSLFRYKSFSE